LHVLLGTVYNDVALANYNCFKDTSYILLELSCTSWRLAVFSIWSEVAV
jgi:hypothetical protein